MLSRTLARHRHGPSALLLLALSCGSDGAPPADTFACDDEVRNGSETDVDCGGDTCDPCALGSLCDTEDDCESGLCRANRCVSPPSCDDGVRNNGETGIDCGGPECDVCQDDGPCDRSSDCESLLCVAGHCSPAECGDGVVQEKNDEECDDQVASAECNADCSLSVCGDGITNMAAGEECDDEGETAACNVDCTTSSCGDGVVNTAAGEECELDDPHCLLDCHWGLDGTFGDTWETLKEPLDAVPALPSFVYAGSPYIYEFYSNARYDIAADEWTPLEEPFPHPSYVYWANGAVSRDALFVPRQSNMYRWDFATETWSVAAENIPDGSSQYSAAVFDRDGHIWYHGPTTTTLVRFTPGKNEFVEFEHDTFDVYETRIAFDPLTNRIVFAGYQSDTLMIFDIESEEFTLSSASDGGEIHDNACQDRSGGIYAGSGDYATMWRYDIAEDTWTDLPALPAPHDNWSTCVVSGDGYLYYGTDAPGFWRLPLGRYTPAE